MKRGVVAGLTALAALMPACAADEVGSGDGTTGEDEVAVTSRCDREFGARIRAKVDMAREKLARLDTPFAKVVRDELESGRVKALPMCKMTRLEFDELAKDSDLTALGATRDEQYASLRRADAPAMKTVHALIYGFQWEDRIYLSTGQSDSRMVETIAHEVQHVLRNAHARNFDDQRVTCVEEIAAFEAEILVKKAELTDEERASVRKNVVELYELDKMRAETCTYR
jgi:hypothetical protein